MREQWLSCHAITELEDRLAKLRFHSEARRVAFELHLAEAMLRFRRRNHAFFEEHGDKPAVLFLKRFLDSARPHYARPAWALAQLEIIRFLMARAATHIHDLQAKKRGS